MATNHWDTIDPEVGNIREQDLQTVFWEKTLNGGAVYKRIETPQRDIGDVIEHILAEKYEAVATKIQEELVVLDKRVVGTEAGEVLADTLQRRIGYPSYTFDSVMPGNRYLSDVRPDDLIIVSVISLLCFIQSF